MSGRSSLESVSDVTVSDDMPMASLDPWLIEGEQMLRQTFQSNGFILYGLVA